MKPNNPAPELEYRLRQQALLAELGRRALTDTSLDALLNEAARATALGLETQYCKVLEYLPDQNRLLVRAGVGWHQGVVGSATVGADLDSPAGYAIHTGKPVIANRLHDEKRFRTPQLLAEHGIERAINVILMSDSRPFGVLEADSQTEGTFSESDGDFMQGVANLLGVAIDHRRTVDALKNLNETLESRVEGEVSARREAEAMLHQMQKMEAVGQLTGGVAHDFNNLLTVISGNLDLIAARTKGDAELERLISAAQKGATRGQQLTGQLLTFARRQALHPEVRSINDLVREFDVLATRVLGEMVKIEFDLDPSAGNVDVDPAQFGSAVLNLVMNARDAMPKGGKVTISTRSVTLDRGGAAQLGLDAMPGSYVMVSVQDTGSGMSPETLARAMEPFFTTKEVGRGTGLGLSQVYGFVRQSGGFLSIASAVGKGTQIQIHLPAAGDAGRGTSIKSGESTGLAGSETLLVVEDDEDVRSILVESLSALGYRVLVARNAPEALECLERERTVHLVISDVIMPGGLTGTELAKRVQREWPTVKLLIISGYATGGQFVRADDDVQGVHILGKPFRQPELGRAVRMALDQPSTKP